MAVVAEELVERLVEDALDAAFDAGEGDIGETFGLVGDSFECGEEGVELSFEDAGEGTEGFAHGFVEEIAAIVGGDGAGGGWGGRGGLGGGLGRGGEGRLGGRGRGGGGLGRGRGRGRGGGGRMWVEWVRHHALPIVYAGNPLPAERR
jgi:hypothetical protein